MKLTRKNMLKLSLVLLLAGLITNHSTSTALPSPAELVESAKNKFSEIDPLRKLLEERIKGGWNGFVKAMELDARIFRGPHELEQRFSFLNDWVKNQVLKEGHMWVPLINVDDNTLVQVPLPPLGPADPTALLMVLTHALRTNIRFLTPLEVGFVFGPFGNLFRDEKEGYFPIPKIMEFPRIGTTNFIDVIVQFIPETFTIGDIPVGKIYKHIATITSAISAVTLVTGIATALAPAILGVFVIWLALGAPMI